MAEFIFKSFFGTRAESEYFYIINFNEDLYSSSSIFTFEEKFYSKQLAANPIETFTNEHRDSNELVGRFF
jgi:hypothetical protein